MKAIGILPVIIIGVALSFCNGTSAKKQQSRAGDKGFAVVELFTSEGCSSCPPADDAIIKLAKEFPDHVYFIGYHVDYWDYIGWKDEFDNPEYTVRQNKYAGIFKLESIYTPQVIVNGKQELVGSKEAQLRTIIQEQLKNAASSGIELSAKTTTGQNITVSYKLPASEGAVLNIALVQLKATTSVQRGENNGRQLNHINIVRALKTVAIDKNGKGSVELAIPNGLNAGDLKLIAFQQDKKDMRIVGAAEALVQ